MLLPVWQQYKGTCLWYTSAMRAKCLWLPPPLGSQGKQSPGQTHFQCPRVVRGCCWKENQGKWMACFCFIFCFSFHQPQPLLGFAQLLFFDYSIHCSAACLQSWGLGDGDRGRSLIPWRAGWNSSASIMATKKLREREGPGTRCTLKGRAPMMSLLHLGTVAQSIILLDIWSYLQDVI